jgi:hypothetical protein
MNLAKRLKCLEQRLGPPPQPSWEVYKLAMAFNREELTLLKERIVAHDRGDPFEDTPQMEDILRRLAVLNEELNRKTMPQEIPGEL